MLKRALLSTVFILPLAAQAADLPARVKAEPAPSAFSWQGFYVGGTVGYGMNSLDHVHEITESQTMNGFNGGVHAGYNFQKGNFVYGFEADIAGTNISDHLSELDHNGGPGTTLLKSRLTGTVRARAGIAFDTTLLYTTAGVSLSHHSLTSDAEPDKTTIDKIGYVVGGGIEQALNKNVIVRVEGLYSVFSSSFVFDDGGEKLKFKNAAVGRVGISYKF